MHYPVIKGIRSRITHAVLFVATSQSTWIT